MFQSMWTMAMAITATLFAILVGILYWNTGTVPATGAIGAAGLSALLGVRIASFIKNRRDKDA